MVSIRQISEYNWMDTRYINYSRFQYFNKDEWALVRSLSSTFENVLLANTNVIPCLRSTIFGFPGDVASHIPHLFIVNMHAAPRNVTKKIATFLTRPFNNTGKRDILKTREWNGAIFDLCFSEVAGMEGSKEIINISAVATVIMPPSTEGNIILDGVTTTHPTSADLVQSVIDDRQQRPPNMDYLVVECDFRRKGLTRALKNCAMIMELVIGVHYPTLSLAYKQNELSHKIYTQHFGFSSHTWCKLSSYIQTYAKEATSVDRYDRKSETREVIPLLCCGLLVKDLEAISRADNSGDDTCTRDVKAPLPGAGGSKVPRPCLNAGNKVPRSHANTGTGGAKGSRPTTGVLI